MQLKWLAIPIISATAVLSYAPTASAITLIAAEEPVMQLVSPSPSIYTMTYVWINGLTVSEPVTSAPLLCGTTSAPSTYASQAVSPIYYGPNSLQPFVFGASALTPTVPAAAPGASVMMSGSTMQVISDPALVCYGLDVNGVPGPTPGVMRDQFEGVNYSPTLNTSFNSSVVLTVFHVPTSSTDFYGYTVDVTIPARPANVNCSTMDCNFALLEGFDSSVFATNSGATHPDEGWCIGSAGSTACSSSTVEGGINLNYSTWANSVLPHLVASGASPASYRFVVKRYLASGVTSLPTSGGPVAIAALFSPFDFDENYIGDNVAVGYGNTPPAVVQSGDTWTTFSGKLGALAENTDSGSLTFNITDPDTAESGGQNLTATVTLNLGGLIVPATPVCSVISGSGAANRQCTLDINFADPNWWNASVDPSYDGLGNVFATDPGGASASASIVAKDSLGKVSALVSVPIHVQSKVNNPPLVSASLPAVADSFQGNALIPTFTCSVSANSCGTRGFVDLPSVLTAAPGPAAAFDELASQTTAVVPYAGGDANGGNVQCASESGTIFATNGNPLVGASSAANSYDANFFLNNPATVGSSLCTVTITDKMAAFPAGESAQTATKQFRVVVNQ